MKKRPVLLKTFIAVDSQNKRYEIQHYQWELISESLDAEPNITEGQDFYRWNGAEVLRTGPDTFRIANIGTHIRQIV